MPPAPGDFLEVSVPDALKEAEGRTIIDVREFVEWNEGHIPTALLVPLADFAATIEMVVPDKSTPLLVHCAVGARSRRAAHYLAQSGYTNVLNIQGRLAEWKALGGAWEVPAQVLTEAERARYSRQILIPEIGQEGQRRLLDAKVLLIGAGGLGSPAGLYLAAAGIGTLGLVDDDVVDESNLQRQVLHTADRVGMAKTESGS
jgi:adenylyltransferase/sulfurtransferase